MFKSRGDIYKRKQKKERKQLKEAKQSKCVSKENNLT